jgi:MinD-like ATPase involved in chromosome partitioning or flagellar assembly
VAGRYPVLAALTGSWEAPLVAALEQARGEVVVVRRCVDLPELLAVAATGRAVAALVSADVRRLDRDALARLRGEGLVVVGVADPGSSEQAERLRALGVLHAVPADADAALVELTVAEALASRPGGAARAADPADPGAALPVHSEPLAPRAPARPRLPDAPVQRGALVAVWGPAGSPGRTTVAVTLAAELAALGRPTLLADADTYAAGVAQTLGVLDEAPGLAAACRSAGAGTLDATMLARLSPTLAPHLRVLTGITRADRWPELAASSLEQVWSVAREVAAFTVVDTGFSLERDEEIVYDTLAPRRNAATLSALEAADVVLAVGAGDPVGLQRLVRGLGELAEAVPHVTPRVVVTRVRASATGSDPHRRVAEALRRYAGVQQVVTVPDDRDALDGALLAGRSLTEHAPTSPARLVVSDLAALLAGNRPTAGTRSGRGRRRRAPA